MVEERRREKLVTIYIFQSKGILERKKIQVRCRHGFEFEIAENDDVYICLEFSKQQQKR